MKNIVLIGFMGSGKSSVGKELAKRLNYEFLDMDAIIEEEQGVKIRRIFEEKGEAYFRDLEEKLFNKLCENETNAVISMGGGAPCFIDDIKQLGFSIYLKIDFEDLLERLKADEFDKRPLFQDLDFARKLYDAREPIYVAKSDLIIDATTNIDDIIALTLRTFAKKRA